MLLIKTNNFKEDIDQIDMLLFGRTDQETWQSEPIFHDGDMYIAYAPKIDVFAGGKDIIDLDPNNSAQSGEAPTESVVKQEPPTQQEVKVIIEKADPIEVKCEPKVIVEKPDAVKIPPIKIPEIVVTPQPVNFTAPNVTVNLDVSGIEEQLKEITKELKKPWWKKLFNKL